MRVLLLQLDGKLPNLALMRLAAHHRANGDEVELRHAPSVGAVERRLGDAFDAVYASLIFEKTRPVAEALRKVYSRVILGGTGWDLTTTLEQFGVGDQPDYSIYPKYRHSIGFSQRGCRLKCSFCVVPRKEGTVRSEATIGEIWRGGSYPKEIVLLDNDFFGQSDWRGRIAEIRDGGYKVCFNQGINCRMVSDEAAEAIASVQFRDDQFKTKRLYTAWDSRPDEDVLFRGLNRLAKCGVKPDQIMVYVLVGFWADETEDDWLYRARRLREFGCRPYPMPYVRNHLTVGFQRWVSSSSTLRSSASRAGWNEARASSAASSAHPLRKIGFALRLDPVAIQCASIWSRSVSLVGQPAASEGEVAGSEGIEPPEASAGVAASCVFSDAPAPALPVVFPSPAATRAARSRLVESRSALISRKSPAYPARHVASHASAAAITARSAFHTSRAGIGKTSVPLSDCLSA